MVFKVAIVEDQDEEANRLISYFKRYEQERDDSFQITRFENGDRFIFNYRPVFDLVLMDIMMPGSNGLDAAKALRDIDRNVTLVFVTNMAQFAVKGYEVEAFDFVVKPVTFQNFVIKMDRTLRKLHNEQKEDFILLNVSEGKKRLAPSQIRYVEVAGHRLIYHTVDGVYEVYGSMKAAEEQLSSKTFSRCNQCFLVNLNYVTGVSGTNALLGEETLQISRSRKAAFMEQLNDFLGGNF